MLAAERAFGAVPQLVASSRPAEAIAHEALSKRAGIVVMGVAAAAAASATARKVLRRGHCPVLLVDSDVRRRRRLMYDLASLAIAAACLLVAFSFIYLLDRV